MAVQVTLSDLTNKVNEGWKKDQLAEYYGLPKAQVGKLLKQAGLTIRKFHLPKFELVDFVQYKITNPNSGDSAIEKVSVSTTSEKSFEDNASLTKYNKSSIYNSIYEEKYQITY